MNLHKYLLLLLCLGLLFACKKEIKNPPNPITEEPTEQDRLRASIYDYFNKYSLWTAQVPDLDEEGRLEFVKKYSSNQSLLTALKNMTPFHSGYSGSIDRFSFIDESGADGNANSSYADGIRMDTNEGYGLYYGWGILSSSATVAYPVIFFVEGGSPAWKEGVTRGSIVYAVNDDENITVGYNGSNLNQADVRRVGTKLEAALEANSLKLKLETASGEDKVFTLGYQDSYDIDPVILDSVYVYPDKNIGYLAYSSFEEVWPNTHQNYVKLEEIFNSFTDANIKDLILDLRYNTGGYVNTAEYLANKMINAADHDKLMFKYEVNDYLATSFQHRTSFQDVYFESNNNQLTLENVYVLVTEQTASAAELLISSLKPYLNVTIIAETDRTYGKPVGFFPEEINDEFTLWVTSFKTINANGYTDYWDGMQVDVANIDDYIFKDFGDSEEDMTAKALNLAGVSTSGMRASSRKSSTARRGIKVGIINKPNERNMLKKRL
ncbi:S41 family peptidase [Sphingobacterium corticibacterium]|uniref:Tail specific protease domain-containing protein n=1 Tax=Sphingobacterium corticibacterium TaxID=2484746 RepID=A0A4Q6XTM2_9SPHI|nr:S41 family peptidase [Sphingobacterium corticibacterium]RZF59937.1 hypothetical protein EWE74_12440 [Sphingobacterium corticibacterium]